ncbi:D-lactate dehydrogenase [Pelagimonas varians]|uniref:Quinone-dependent D-lactate dehydrogenase n=1 Tax=Pelagimonas varians TaxID=696760 RepID=A0A238L3B4_9RHOB|nr:D-lactate dehydrogenase [Pelagimonas varians]PYG26602.1 D-lactate dehydrogenase [Pelagimonas varians]SMX49509.1 D-lactate dehydrogenase [Pelagimonas varians]
MTDHDLIDRLKQVCGAGNVLTDARRTLRFRKGFRSGEGDALAVVQPKTLLEQWQVLQACVAADKIVIMQAANTGLTEGSTPKGTYDRGVVLINTRRMDDIQLLDNGKQVISFPGSTLFKLEKLLAPLGRQPHSVIGSSCIGASVVGGVCNNSGGSLVERGPSYTELSLFARITPDGVLELVNHLGINLGSTPEEILNRVQSGDYSAADMEVSNRRASDTDYVQRVRDIEADTPARFNADKSRLYEAAGCAGKLAVFAVRLDTYPKNDLEKTFYVGSHDTAALGLLRRSILAGFETLPVSAEYLHEDVFDLSDVYGKDTMVMIDKLGTDRLPMFFALKGAVDARLSTVPGMGNFTDKFMQTAAKIWPNVIPKRMRTYRKTYPHHLILKMRDGGIDEARALLSEMSGAGQLDFFECDDREAKMAGLLRFAAAGAAVRYMNVHRSDVEDIIALDIALRRNDEDWFEELPAEISDQLVSKLYYGHFMCHVLHQDYIVKKGADPKRLKAAMLEILDKRGAEYPAEHNVGHLYPAKPDLAAFYKSVDPTNSLNPGIGKMSRNKSYS